MGDVSHDVGQILLGQVLLQPFRHQRLAGALQLVQIGAEQNLFLAFLSFESDARRRFAGQDPRKTPAGPGRGQVLDVARIHLPAGIENRDQ